MFEFLKILKVTIAFSLEKSFLTEYRNLRLFYKNESTDNVLFQSLWKNLQKIHNIVLLTFMRIDPFFTKKRKQLSGRIASCSQYPL